MRSTFTWSEERRSRAARQRALRRKATTEATETHGIGGLRKRGRGPAKVTLPTIKGLDPEDAGLAEEFQRMSRAELELAALMMTDAGTKLRTELDAAYARIEDLTRGLRR